MVKRISLFVCFVLLFCITANTYAQDADAEIPQLGVTPVIDGQMEALWGALTPHDMTVFKSGETTVADCSGNWRAFWDAQYIYVFVVVTDDNLSSDNTGAATEEYQDDSIELYFDIHNDKATTFVDPSDDYQYRFSWEPTTPTVASDKAWNATTGIELAMVTTSTGYMLSI